MLIGNAFENLYQNVDGMADAWANFWRQLAVTVSDLPSVLGYELINEPWGGDALSEPRRYIPGVADREVLQPVYDRLAAAIRSVDANALVFFAAVTFDDVVPVGFTAPPGGEEFSDRSVFAYHFYKPPQFTEAIYFEQRMRDAQRLSTGAMLTEFERSNGDNDTISDPFITAAEAADFHLQSWSMWEFKTFCKESNETLVSDSQSAAFGACKTGYGSHLFWDDSGNFNTAAGRKLARTYAQRTAGNLSYMSFNATTSDFRLVFSPARATASSAGEFAVLIFAHHTLNYPQGYEVNVVPKNALLWEVTGPNSLTFSYADNYLFNSSEIEITIKNV
jgi:endoglycosylceramidase